VTAESKDDAPDILWGAEAIGKAIGRPPRATFYLLESGAIPGRKVGSKWVASRRKLLEALFGEGKR
jgi:hypothetical protein